MVVLVFIAERADQTSCISVSRNEGISLKNPRLPFLLHMLCLPFSKYSSCVFIFWSLRDVATAASLEEALLLKATKYYCLIGKVFFFNILRRCSHTTRKISREGSKKNTSLSSMAFVTFAVKKGHSLHPPGPICVGMQAEHRLKLMATPGKRHPQCTRGRPP